MSESIMQENKECFITGSTVNLDRHHIFFGSANRKLSEQYGLWVWLTHEIHNAGTYCVHREHELDLMLKQKAQKKAMKHYGWTIIEFIKIFGRNYLI